ncbi:MAG: DUF1249 domain-containing protein [Bacteroidia bacterium]|nr:DUF1249 domain-containing protein [Bacteroidia bacterium]
MTRKKQETSGKGESASIHRWADEVIAITENPKQRGIEIRFNAEPSPQLQPKLRAMSFRHSKMKTMWYGDSTPEALEFAEKVKAALPTSTDGPDLFLSPSVEAVRTNIENREFSFVMITLTDGQIKNYIIFEASKPKAEVIATNFARQEFGDRFLSLAALPKTHIKEARTLFDEGKIIYPEGQKVPTHKASIIKGLNPKSSEISEEIYETEGDKKRELENLALQKFYKWAAGKPEFAGKTDSISRELFDNWLKENYPELGSSSIENMWRSHERIIKSFKRYEKRSTGKPLAQPYSAIYKKLMQIIPDLIKHIEAGKDSGKSVKDPKGGLMDLNFDYLGKDKKGNYLIALSHLFEQNGDLVPDPDMQIRIIPEMEMAEAMTFQDQYGYQVVYPDQGDGKEYVDLRRKKELNQFLSQWLTNIIKQGHKIDLTQEESEIEDDENSTDSLEDKSFTTSKAKENPKLEFERLHTPEEEKEIIEQFLAQGFKRPFSAQEAFDKNLPVIDLAFRYVESMEYFRDHIENPRKKKVQELREELKNLKGEKGVNDQKNSLKEQIEQLEAEMTFAEKLVQDESLIFQDDLFAIILQKGKQRGYAGEIEDNISRFRDYVVTNILDNRAIENYHKDSVQIVVNELIDEYFNSKEEKTTPDMKSSKPPATAIAEDLKTGDTFLPNVLVPVGTTEPFLSHNFQLFDMKSVLKTNFPHLLKINEKNLSKASALEMFELVQMAHPTDYGIDVSRMKMLEEWEKRGRELFEELGFPTDNIYPYINLYLGYESIEPLGEILSDNNKEGNEWWAVAEHCRPIADAKKALEIIQHQIQKQKNEKKGLINPKTNKPKLEYKQLAQDIDHTVENLEDSKEVIQHYIDNPLEASHSKKVEKKSKDPLTNDSGVYTEKTAGKNYERIEIPMPKAGQYEAVIKIVKTSDNDYKIGIDASKKFGDYNGMMYGPSEDGQPYASREAALKGALKEHELKLELLLIAKDSSFGNEEKKIKNLTVALEAVRDFAKENDVVLDKPKVPGEEISLKEIHLSEKENYSKALVVNTWQEANDFIKNKKWNNDTVYFKVVWKDGETFERKLDQLNAQLYEKKPNPLSDFVYQYNLTISQMKPLKGYHLKDTDISNAAKIVEGYSFSDKKSSSKEITVELDEIVPVPGVDVDFGHLSTAGERNRISAETYKQISKLLQNSKTDLFYYKDAAWTIVKGSTHAILELPEMISNAKSYYEKVYKTSAAYLKKQGKETGIIKGLEAAYWTKEDNKYPQNKAFVNRMEFNQSRLRKAIEDKLEKLPLDTLQNIADELSKKFGERRAFDTYEKGYVTIGKTGDKRKATLIAIYVDNMIVDNDLTDKDDYPVMTFMVDLLFADSQKFVDLPQHIEKQGPSKMKKQSQHELNKEIEAFIEKKDKEGSSFNEEEKNYIRQYTGSGGLIKEGAAGRGVLYEYYTPDVVVQKMWGMAFKYGYDGGSVLEPSVGTGNFLKYAPKDAIVFGFETNHFSARIAQILYPNAHIHEKSFESLFFAGNIHLKDDFDHPLYSLVIGNPPYGDFTGKYAGMGEKKWTGATEYDQYFILRGLDLLKKGGLLVFVVPSSFLSYNVKSAKVKEKIASKVDLMDAYRLPIRTFDTTDIGTDILLLRKK